MTSAPKRNAPVARGANVDTVMPTRAKPRPGRREAQGIALARNVGQPPPAWTRSPQADAADDLAQALGIGRGRQ